MVRNVKSTRIEADELWSYCGCKEKAKKQGAQGHGDAWVWVGLDPDSKLVVSYLVGHRNGAYAEALMYDIARRVDGVPQVTTDAFQGYRWAVAAAFDGKADYAQVVKRYGTVRDDAGRYSPPVCTGCTKKRVTGDPDLDTAGTSLVERQNLSVRMGMRRFTRLTNGFSKRLENHEHAIAIHYWHYNFARKHMTLKTTPAVAAGIASKPMTMLDLIRLVEAEEKRVGGRLTDYLAAEKKAS